MLQNKSENHWGKLAHCILQREFSSVQFSSVQFSSVQFSSVQFSSVQFSSVQFSSVQFSSVQFSSETERQPWNYRLVQNTDVSVILEYHKMLLMSHLNKTVIIITTKGRPTNTWIKNLNIVRIKDN